MGMNGSSFLLLVNTGTDEAPAYEAVGCQRDATIEETSQSIDMSCKNQREEIVIPGRYASTLSLDAVYVPDDASYIKLRNAVRNGEMILVAAEENDEVIETALANVESLSRSYPDQDGATVSISMKISGAWEAVGS